MIDHLVVRSLQRLGVIYHVKDYLGQSGLFKSFISPVCEYGNLIFRPLLENSLFPISRPHADSLPAWSFIIAVNIYYLSCDCIGSIAVTSLALRKPF